MNRISSLAWDMSVIRILMKHMRHFKADDLVWKWEFDDLQQRHVTHRMPTIIERLDSGHDTSYMRIAVDVAASFDETKFHNAIFYRKRQVIEDLLALLTVVLAKESDDRKSLDVGHAMNADIDVLGKAVQLKINMVRVSENRWQTNALSWHVRVRGILARIWMQLTS